MIHESWSKAIVFAIDGFMDIFLEYNSGEYFSIYSIKNELIIENIICVLIFCVSLLIILTYLLLNGCFVINHDFKTCINTALKILFLLRIVDEFHHT